MIFLMKNGFKDKNPPIFKFYAGKNYVKRIHTFECEVVIFE